MGSQWSDYVREEVRRLHGDGLRRQQIALRLGISLTTVTSLKAELAAAGHLPARGATPISVRVAVEHAVPPAGRSRSEILIEQAALRARTLDAATRSLLDHVVGADEWVTDPEYAARVRAVAAAEVSNAMERLEQIAEQMGIARGASGDPA